MRQFPGSTVTSSSKMPGWLVFESAMKNAQRTKLVARSHLRTIIVAWLITVPATAAISGLLFLAIKEIVPLGNAL